MALEYLDGQRQVCDAADILEHGQLLVHGAGFLTRENLMFTAECCQWFHAAPSK